VSKNIPEQITTLVEREADEGNIEAMFQFDLIYYFGKDAAMDHSSLHYP